MQTACCYKHTMPTIWDSSQCRQEKGEAGGIFPPPQLYGLWTCADVSKRVARSLFLDLGLALLSSAESSLLKQLVGNRYIAIECMSMPASVLLCTALQTALLPRTSVMFNLPRRTSVPLLVLNVKACQ